MRSLIAVGLFALPVTASAGIYGGNPKIMVELERYEDDITVAVADVAQVDVVHCDDTVDEYIVGEEVDLEAGWSLDIDGGDLCRVVIEWDSVIEAESAAWTIEVSRNNTTIPVDGPIPGQVMAPFTVTSGTYSGTNPVLQLTID